jgi:hypothetical protein
MGSSHMRKLLFILIPVLCFAGLAVLVFLLTPWRSLLRRHAPDQSSYQEEIVEPIIGQGVKMLTQTGLTVSILAAVLLAQPGSKRSTTPRWPCRRPIGKSSCELWTRLP